MAIHHWQMLSQISLLSNDMRGVECGQWTNGLNQTFSPINREIFEHYDDKYLKHWFQRDPERKDEELLEFYEKILLEQVIPFVQNVFFNQLIHWIWCTEYFLFSTALLQY